MADEQLSPVEAARRRRSLDLLSVAAMAGRGEAAAAWRDWLAEQDIDRASWSEVRLLGVVSRRLPELATGHMAEARLPGIRKFLWVQTQACLKACVPLLSGLAKLGIPILLLKGAARVAVTPRAAAERLIRDVDILVPPADADRALRYAIAQGWIFDGWQIDARRSDPHAAHHAWSVRGAGGELDIHHFSNYLNRLNTDDDGMWARSQPALLEGLACRVAAPADALLTSLAHGVRCSTDGARDWMVDALELVRSGRFDWSVFLAETAQRKLEAIALDGFRQLESATMGPVAPDEVRRALNHARSPARDAELKAYAEAIWPSETAQQEALAEMATQRAVAARPAGIATTQRSGQTVQWHFGPDTNTILIELRAPDTAERATLRVLFRSPLLTRGGKLTARLHLPGLPVGRFGEHTVPIDVPGAVGLTFVVPARLISGRGMTSGRLAVWPSIRLDLSQVEIIARWDFASSM